MGGPELSFRALVLFGLAAACEAAPPPPAQPLIIEGRESADCSQQSICELCENATAVIRAEVLTVGTMSPYRFVQDGTPAEAFMTPVGIGNVRVLHGSVPLPLTELRIIGPVDANGRSRNGPLTSTGGTPLTLYFFVSDYRGQLPLYSLECGGQFLVLPRADGGTSIEVTSVYSSTPGKATVLDEGAFLREVDANWGRTDCR